MKLNYFFTATALAYGSSLVLAIPIEREFEPRRLYNVTNVTHEAVDFEARELLIIDIEAREVDDLEGIVKRDPQGGKRGGGKGRKGGGPKGRRASHASGAESPPTE